MENVITFGYGRKLYQNWIFLLLMFSCSLACADLQLKADVSAITVTAGGEFSFTCTVIGELKPYRQITLIQHNSRHSKFVLWNDLNGLNSKILDGDGKSFRYSVSNLSYVVNSITHLNVTLRVKDVDKTDKGHYRCTLRYLAFPQSVLREARVQVTVTDDTLHCEMYPKVAFPSNCVVLYCYMENPMQHLDLQWEDSIGNILPSVRFKDDTATVIIAQHNVTVNNNVSFTCESVGSNPGRKLRTCNITPVEPIFLVTVTPLQVLEPGESALFMCNVSSGSTRNAWWEVTDKDGVTVIVRKTFGRYNVSPNGSLLRINNVTIFDHNTVVECVVDNISDMQSSPHGTLYVFARHSKSQNEREESGLDKGGSSHTGRGHYRDDLDERRNGYGSSVGTDWSYVKRQRRSLPTGNHQGSNKTIAGFATTRSPAVNLNDHYLNEEPATNVSYDRELPIPSKSMTVVPTIVCSLLLFSIFASIALLIFRLMKRQDNSDVGTARFQVQHSDTISILSDTMGMQSRASSLPFTRGFVRTIRKPSVGLLPIRESSLKGVVESRSLPNHETKYIHFLESSDEFPLRGAYQVSQPLPDVSTIRLSTAEGAVAVLMNAAASGKGDSISSGEFCYRTASEKITSNARGHSRVRKIAPKSKSLMKQTTKDRARDRRFRRSPSEHSPKEQTGGILYTEIDWSNTVPRAVVNFSSERTVYAIVDTMNTSYQYEYL